MCDYRCFGFEKTVVSGYIGRALKEHWDAVSFKGDSLFCAFVQAPDDVCDVAFMFPRLQMFSQIKGFINLLPILVTIHLPILLRGSRPVLLLVLIHNNLAELLNILWVIENHF